MNPFKERIKLKIEKPRCEQCLGCTEREVGCRSTCKHWIAYEEAYKEWEGKKTKLMNDLECHYDSNVISHKEGRKRKK